jgi:hypothetical protein
MMRMTAAQLWERGQEGWPRRFPIVQFPNPPLLVALAGRGLETLTEGSPHDAGRGLFLVGFGGWGLEEALGGANWLRRLIGAGALVWLAAKATKETFP